MNSNDAARLAAAINLIRPEWPTPSLQTFILDKLGRRPFRDAAVALTYVACEQESKTPARVLEAGPWWKVGADDFEPARARMCGRCSEFHLPAKPCEPVKPRGKHGVHIAEARELLRDVKARLCKHSVVPWLCADCTPPGPDVPTHWSASGQTSPSGSEPRSSTRSTATTGSPDSSNGCSTIGTSQPPPGTAS